MDPLYDPDLMEFMDDESLLSAFERVDPHAGSREVIREELVRRNLVPSAATPDRENARPASSLNSPATGDSQDLRDG